MSTIIFGTFMVGGFLGLEENVFKQLSNVFSVLTTGNLFDGPVSISSGTTIHSKNLQPTLEQMKYYYYYDLATHCPDVKNLTCAPCQKFKNHVNAIAGMFFRI